VKGNFEFRVIINWTTVVSKDMAEFLALKPHPATHKLSYFTFQPKSQKVVKAVVSHLPINTPPEDTSNGLADLAFHVIGVKKIKYRPPVGHL
jgi:hypothetical protein